MRVNTEEKAGELVDIPFIMIQDFLFQMGLKLSSVEIGPQEILSRKKLNSVEFSKLHSADKTVKKVVRKSPEVTSLQT